jgi:hypothetical protein
MATYREGEVALHLDPIRGVSSADAAAPAAQGPILRNFISGRNFSVRLSSSNFGQSSTQTNITMLYIHTYVGIMDDNLGFLGVLKPYLVIISNLDLTELVLFQKFRPKRFHKIDSRPAMPPPHTMALMLVKQVTQLSCNGNLTFQKKKTQELNFLN